MQKTLAILISVIVVGLVTGGAWWYLNRPADFGIDVSADEATVNQTDASMTGQSYDDQAADESAAALDDLEEDNGIATSAAFDSTALGSEEGHLNALDTSISGQSGDDASAGSTTTQLQEVSN